jgi:uncharacterized SAM-binding protein YcdF (DUF218 family)
MTESYRSFRMLSTRLNCVVALGLAILLLSTIGWLWRQPLLEQIADFWTVSDQVDGADAIVILGGGVHDRSKIAADLYRRGLAKRVLISDVLDSSHAIVGGHYSDTTLSRETLRRYGVPDEAVETFGADNKNTRDEAAALRDWSDRNVTTSFIIPTEFLFSRRVRWIFNHEFFGRNVRIAILPFETAHYNHKDWWKTDEGRRAFKLELLKLVYYHIRY